MYRETRLLKDNGTEKLFWIVFQNHKRVAEILSGKVGEPGEIEKIQTDLFATAEPIIQAKIEALLKDGYEEVSHEVFEPLILIILENCGDNPEEKIPEELMDSVWEKQVDINGFLLMRGLTIRDCFTQFEEGNLVMRFGTLDTALTAHIIDQFFKEELEALRREAELKR
jgi:hypothetical protein